MPRTRPALVVEFIDTVKVELVEVNIEVNRTAKALDQRHDTRLGLGFLKACFLAKVERNGVRYDVEHLTHDLRSDCQEEPNLDGKADHPLANRFDGEHFVHQVDRTL